MDDRLHRSVAVAILLIAVAVVAGWRALGDSPTVAGRGALAAVRPLSNDPSPELAQLVQYAAPVSDSAASEASVSAETPSISLRRDPFAPSSVPPTADESPRTDSRGASRGGSKDRDAVSTSELQVTATLMAGDRRAAVINDSLVYVGEPVPGGGWLTTVERDRVVVTDVKGAAHTLAVTPRDG